MFTLVRNRWARAALTTAAIVPMFVAIAQPRFRARAVVQDPTTIVHGHAK